MSVFGFCKQFFLFPLSSEHPENATRPPVTVKVAPSPYPDAEERANITGLDKYTKYFITVLCFTHPGDGKRSDPIVTQTLEDGKPKRE